MTYARTAQNEKNVICSTVPNCFYLLFEGSWQKVFKVMKNDHFLVFLAVWVIFQSFWAG